MDEAPPTTDQPTSPDAPQVPLEPPPLPLGKRLLHAAIDWIKTVVIVALIVVTVRAYVVEAYVIKGPSMEDTFHDGDRLLISKVCQWSTELSTLERGDIVIFRRPCEQCRGRGTLPTSRECPQCEGTGEKRLIKRIIAFEGETVEIEDGHVYIDGHLLEEPFVRDRIRDNVPPVTIGPGMVYVLGDHRSISRDSRRFGPISRQDIIGKAVFLMIPLDRVQYF